jgi:hypothetical protein
MYWRIQNLWGPANLVASTVVELDEMLHHLTDVHWSTSSPLLAALSASTSEPESSLSSTSEPESSSTSESEGVSRPDSSWSCYCFTSESSEEDSRSFCLLGSFVALGDDGLLTFFIVEGGIIFLFVPFFAIKTIGSCGRRGLQMGAGEAENKP